MLSLANVFRFDQGRRRPCFPLGDHLFDIVLTNERIEAIRARLTELVRIGAYKQAPPLSLTDLSKLEANFGVTLPGELRIFLTHVQSGGAGPGDGLFVCADREPLPRRSRPFPFDDRVAQQISRARLDGTDPWACAELPDEEEDDAWPPGPGFVPIAHHGCGVCDVIVTVGDQRGFIWCCDMNWCPCFNADGKGLGFLDWYEDWLDRKTLT